MDMVEVVYREEAGHWSAESPQVPELFLGSETLNELRQQTRDALSFFFECPIEPVERVEGVTTRAWTPAAQSLWSDTSAASANVSGRVRDFVSSAIIYGQGPVQAMPV